MTRFTTYIRNKSSLTALILGFALILCSWTANAEKLSYSFKNKSLATVLEKISADNRIKIAFDTQLASKQSVSGKFRARTIDDLLNSILSSCQLEAYRIGTAYVVKPKKAAPATFAISPLVTTKIEIPKFKIWGTITDVETGEKLPYAYIYSEDKKYAVTANAEGYFNLILPSQKPITLCISYLGFEKKCIEVTPETKSGMLSINLDRAVTTLNSVIVTRKTNELVQIPNAAGKNTLNPQAASDVPSLNPLDFTSALQLLPGIDATVETSAGLSIRKSPSSQTIVTFDGYTLYHISHFLGQLSAFNTKAIKDIQIFKGGFDARYGGAASSIIEITGKSGNLYKPQLSIGADHLSADAFIDTPIGKKLSLVVAIRRSYTDIYQTSLYNDLFDKIRNDIAASSVVDISSYKEKYTPKYHFLDLHSKLTYNPDSTQSVSLSIYGGEDKMNLYSQKKSVLLSENSDIDNKGIGLKWSKQANDRLFVRTSFGYSSYSLSFDHSNSLSNANSVVVANRYSSLYNHLKDFTGKTEVEYRLTPSIDITSGVVYNDINSGYSFENYRKNQQNINIDTTRIEDTRGNIVTSFAQFNMTKKWLKSLTLGARASYFSPNGKIYLEPRAQMSVAAGKNITLKMAAGRYLQFINSIKMPFIGDFTSYWTIAKDKKTPIIRSNHFIAGFSYTPTSKLLIDVESYYKHTTGMVMYVFAPTITKKKYQLGSKEINNNNDIIGVDILAKYEINKGQIALAYSLSKSTISPQNVKKSAEYPAPNDQRHEFTLFASRKVWRFNFSASWIFGSGKPWDNLIIYENFKPTPNYKPFSETLKPYHRLDIASSYEQKIGRTRLNVSATLFNVYDNKNEISQYYTISDTPIQDIEKGKSPLKYSKMYGLRFTPSLYINLTF